MFAVIKTGGKQYRVAADDVLRIERIEGSEGSRVEFGQVLMVGNGSDVSIGTPAVDGATVTAEVIEQGRGKKTISFKKRRRQNSRRKKGHRQLLTTVSILEILTNGAKPSRDASGKSAADRTAEAQAAYAASVGASASDDAATDKGTSRAETAEVEDGATDEGLVSGSDAPVEAAKPAKAKKAKPVVESEDDAAADHAEEQAADTAATAAPTKQDAGVPDADTPDEPLFSAPEGGEKDKLTKIKGIGPVAERQLNEQGLTTFAQLAELTDEDVERIDAYMPFSAAQIRTWQEQAKTLK